MNLLRRLRDFAVTALVFGGAVYGYLSYRTSSNLREHLANLESNRDNTRPDNESFGIGWGYRADDIVMSQIDSADLLLLKFDCTETLSVPQYIRCMKSTALKLDHEYHGLAVAFRNEDGLRILTNEFDQTKVESYPELVAKPYLKELSIRKIKDLSPLLQSSLSKIAAAAEQETRKESPQQMFNRVYGELGILTSDLVRLNDLDSQPPIKNEYESQIYVRTTTARNLRNQ